MPVSSGRWPRNSLNASRPPAEAPTPTISRTVGSTAKTGVAAAVEVLGTEGVRRLGRDETGTRGECATWSGRLPPFFIVTRHPHFSGRNERDEGSTRRAILAPGPAPLPGQSRLASANRLNCNAVRIWRGGRTGIRRGSGDSGNREQILDGFAD